MRIWDLPPSILCRQHLLGEHRELHAIWNIITKNKKGYSKHPETKRWVDKQKSLFNRHEKLVDEMMSRGYNHKSNLNKIYATGSPRQNKLINTRDEQRQILKSKNCKCKI